MNIWRDYIGKIDPAVDPEAVLDWADDQYRIFSQMTAEQWKRCVELAKTHGRICF